MKREEKREYIPQMFADYTLGVEITGEAGSVKKAAKEADGALDSVKRTAKQTAQDMAAAFSGMKKSLSDVSKGFTDAGKAMSMAITAPVVGVAKKSVDAFNEIDAGLDTIIQKTGATGDAAADLGKVFENVYGSLPMDSKTVGDAIGEVNTRFRVTGNELAELSDAFLKFADLNGTEVSASVDNVQQVMAAFGLETKDAALFLDTLTKAGQDTGASMDALLAQMSTNAASLKELGFNASDSTKFLSEMSVAGVDSAAVMTGLKKALVAAAKDGKEMPQALAELQAAMQNADTKAEGLQAAIDIFGSKAGPAIYDACMDGRLSFEQLGTSMTDAAGTVNSTFESMQDPPDKLKTAMNDLNLSMADMGATIMTTVLPYVQDFSGKVKELAEWFNNLSPAQQDMAIKFAAIAAAIGPLLIFIGTLIGSVASIAGAFSTLSTMIAGLIPEGMTLAGVFGAINWPIVLIVGAIALLVGAFIYLWNTNEDFRNAVIEIWNNIVETVSGVINSIIEGVTGLVAMLAEAWDAIYSKAAEVWQALVDTVMSIVLLFCDLLSGDMDAFKEDLLNIQEKLSEEWGRIWEDIKNTASELFQNIIDFVVSHAQEIPGAIHDAFDDFIDFITGLPGDAIQWGADIIGGIVDGIFSGIHRIAEAASSVASTIRGYLGFSEPDIGPLSDFHTYMPDMIGLLSKGMYAGAGKIQDAAAMLAGSIYTGITGAGASSQAGAYAAGGSGPSVGGIYMTVNGAQGQDVDALADIVTDKIVRQIELYA